MTPLEIIKKYSLKEINNFSNVDNLKLSNSKVKNIALLMSNLHSENFDLELNASECVADYILERYKIYKKFFEDKETLKLLSKSYNFYLDPQMLDLQLDHLKDANEMLCSENDRKFITLAFTPKNLFYDKGDDEIFIKFEDIYYGHPIWDLALCISGFFYKYNLEKAMKFKNLLVKSYEEKIGKEIDNKNFLESIIIFFDLEKLYLMIRNQEDIDENYFERLLKKLHTNYFIKWS